MRAALKNVAFPPLFRISNITPMEFPHYHKYGFTTKKN